MIANVCSMFFRLIPSQGKLVNYTDSPFERSPVGVISTSSTISTQTKTTSSDVRCSISYLQINQSGYISFIRLKELIPIYVPIAQSAERCSYKAVVAGSIPARYIFYLSHKDK